MDTYTMLFSGENYGAVQISMLSSPPHVIQVRSIDASAPSAAPIDH